MKRMLILGLFFGTLMLLSYQPPAQAMLAFAPGFVNVDGVVVKAYTTYRRARVTARRTARRVYRRHY